MKSSNEFTTHNINVGRSLVQRVPPPKQSDLKMVLLAMNVPPAPEEPRFDG